ncbi:MAG: protoheme IX farnesyltransferase [Opitutia bacterium TMED102]|nr:protoheme IX farnesyltransferase [Verrucomicrobiales bacterium]OUV39735.1 MAG: protoheme IX farnesyltransferase [Opitutae bacterium TMED102]
MGKTIQQTEVGSRAKASNWQIFSELVKLRLSALVLITTLVGFYAGLNGETGGLSQNLAKLGLALLGTGLLAAGAAVLNQYLEREYDARMNRTLDRPLPSGTVGPEAALLLGGAFSVIGLLTLSAWVNLLVAVLGAVTLVTYLFVYTPLKRKSEWNTIIGAIPGALPPLMGWAAARGQVDPLGWTLFGILFFWQVPHFMAIAWLYREDYAKAGFVMLPNVDEEGVRTGRQAISHTVFLAIASLMPFTMKLVGTVYLAGAILLGMLFLLAAVKFSRDLSRQSARRLFFASIIYLPLLLGLMVVDKLGI